MWDLAGLELTAVHGTWSERSYALADIEDDTVTLLMSAEESPRPGWVHRLPDEFYGGSRRCATSVPRAEVTDMHSTIVQGTLGDVFVNVLAQRFDRSWAVSANETNDISEEMLRRLGLTQASAVGPWSGWVAEDLVEITGRVSYASWPQPCS
jgi:hypothetical protein